jgi:uncharacterized protein YbcC (UPF0753/DUF2309 family)
MSMSSRDTVRSAPAISQCELEQLLVRVAERIAPAWPLDRAIAVNPFWSRIDTPLPELSAELTALSGARLVMPRSYYHDAWRNGAFGLAHVHATWDGPLALPTAAELEALLARDEPSPRQVERMMDVAEPVRGALESNFREFVVPATSRFCAAYFDTDQAALAPDRSGGLYMSFRRHALRDGRPAMAMGLRSFREHVAELPADHVALAWLALCELPVLPALREPYLYALLLDVSGWASACAYRRWMAQQKGERDTSVEELLALRLSWELILYREAGPEVRSRFRRAVSAYPHAVEQARRAQALDWAFQRALERAQRDALVHAIPHGLGAQRPTTPGLQAVFCIDVRSEPLRRALEAQSSSIQTLGYAGFFGLPLAYRQPGAEHDRPQAPGLLAPTLRAVDIGGARQRGAQRAERIARRRSWSRLQGGTVSLLSVEVLGLAHAASLARETLGLCGAQREEHEAVTPAERKEGRPRLTETVGGGPLPLAARCELAESVLRGMGLTRNFARIVLLVGHASSSRNNPHAAGLDCGACCGQSGEVNARAAAALLNDVLVRQGLHGRGIEVPITTRFVPALHDTTTDDVLLFDEDVALRCEDDLALVRAWLAGAAHVARAERAPALGLDASERDRLAADIRARARSFGEVRPEWGLANNAAFIAAPREHLKHLQLAGRAFLHEYRASEDRGHEVLEKILTAPVLVAHWINLQYYASTVAPRLFGSGDKQLHDVVGGRLGVFEGNGGDLRVGLPLQSVLDGTRFVHTPLRLGVFVEAPAFAIERIVKAHAQLRALVDQGWITLYRIDAEAGRVLERVAHDDWRA